MSFLANDCPDIIFIRSWLVPSSVCKFIINKIKLICDAHQQFEVAFQRMYFSFRSDGKIIIINEISAPIMKR